MPCIDPWIIEHEIKTYPNATPFLQKIRDVNPRKALTIKPELEKLLRAGFIYPILLTKCLSNPFPVNKKQGTIQVCTNFQYLNKVCPKDNYPTPFIDQIINDCASGDIFSFMDGFSIYNKIPVKQKDKHKIAFIFSWGTFTYKKMPFGLKNARAMFQRAMSYALHYIRNIVQAYLDYLTAHSKKRVI